MSESLHTPGRPNDEIRFGDGGEPDWDQFLESLAYETKFKAPANSRKPTYPAAKHSA